MTHTSTRGRVVLGLVSFLVVSVGLFAVHAARAEGASSPQANLFDLRGGGITVNYAASSLDGRPRLTYRAMGQTRSFAGDEITAADTALGTLVTVTLAAIPDQSTTTFTVVIPQVNVETGQTATVRTQGFTTVGRTSIGGPALVRGQVQTNRVVTLTGTAQAVVF
jgi:hypothetical protein